MSKEKLTKDELMQLKGGIGTNLNSSFENSKSILQPGCWFGGSCKKGCKKGCLSGCKTGPKWGIG